jgi:DNA-binding transcriptional ArsR family regulator
LRISDPVLKGRILEALGDPDSPKIFHALGRVPKNAQTLADETTIPLSSIYRKLAVLRAAGLVLVKSFEITPEGKRQDLFVAAVTEVRMGLGKDEVELELIPTDESANRIWFKLFNK